MLKIPFSQGPTPRKARYHSTATLQQRTRCRHVANPTYPNKSSRFLTKGILVSNNPYQNPPGANFQQELPQGMAVASLVTGILSLTICGLFTAIPAIICGHIGVKQADRGEASGRSMAMAGMIMGYVSLALYLLAIIAYVVVVVVIVGAAAAQPGGF
ncbi:MAG: DUF4190 domain-containing protein [Rubripirellula sp.]